MTVAEIFDHVERKFNIREKQGAQERFPQRRQRKIIWQREVEEIGNVNEGDEPPKGGDAGAKRTNKTKGRSATRAASPPPTLPVPQLAPPPSPPPPAATDTFGSNQFSFFTSQRAYFKSRKSNKALDLFYGSGVVGQQLKKYGFEIFIWIFHHQPNQLFARIFCNGITHNFPTFFPNHCSRSAM
jgi:hypothetical protein